MDKSAFAKAAVAITAIYCVLAMISIGCESIYSALYDSNYELARTFYAVGSGMAPFILIILPLFMVPQSFVLSVIGIIKSKRVLPYLLLPPLPLLLWLITVGTYGRYI